VVRRPKFMNENGFAIKWFKWSHVTVCVQVYQYTSRRKKTVSGSLDDCVEKDGAFYKTKDGS
jgi:hypothetical protein